MAVTDFLNVFEWVTEIKMAVKWTLSIV